MFESLCQRIMHIDACHILQEAVAASPQAGIRSPGKAAVVAEGETALSVVKVVISRENAQPVAVAAEVSCNES